MSTCSPWGRENKNLCRAIENNFATAKYLAPLRFSMPRASLARYSASFELSQASKILDKYISKPTSLPNFLRNPQCADPDSQHLLRLPWTQYSPTPTATMRLTAELIQSSLSYLNPLKERELDLRGAYSLKRTDTNSENELHWYQSWEYAGIRSQLLRIWALWKWALLPCHSPCPPLYQL